MSELMEGIKHVGARHEDDGEVELEDEHLSLLSSTMYQ